MAEPTPQSAARLSEDIGDVLTAIRRLIADDEALSKSRDKLRSDRSAAIDEDAAEFLARRYGGNAALARRLARHDGEDAPRDGDHWPLGRLANNPTAARPHAERAAAAQIRRHEEPDGAGKAPSANDGQPPQNDLARTLAALSRCDAIEDQPFQSGSAAHQEAAPRTPLRLEPARRATAEAATSDTAAGAGPGWRGWIRPEPKLRADPVVAASHPADDRGDQFAALVDEQDEFAEAFDWKARMRPDLHEAAKDCAVTADAAPQVDDLHVAEGTPNRATTSRADVSGWVSAAPRTIDAAAATVTRDTNLELPAVQQQASLGGQTVTGLSPEEEEQSIRDLLRDMIQEELHGELGQRFSRNLRAVIRREVAAAIDDQLDRF